MADDIFDQVGAKPAGNVPAAKGDIFDQVAVQNAPVPQQITSQAKLAPAPKAGLDFSSPAALGGSLAAPIRNYFTEAQNLTPEGRATQPIKAALGKAAGFAFGGSQGIGTKKEGILTDPVIGAITGVGPGEAIASKLPSIERAGLAMNKIVSASKNVSVPVFDATAEAARAKEIANAGTSLPKPVSTFLRRVLDPDKPPITIEEARDFYTNISKLTGKEWSEFNAPMKRQIATFAKALGDNIEQALNIAKPGEGTALRSAMDEYHNAMLLKSFGGKALKVGGGMLAAGGIEEALRYLWRQR